MSPCKAVSPEIGYVGSTSTKRLSQNGGVLILEPSSHGGEYHERLSTLELEIRAEEKSPQKIIFVSTEVLSAWVCKGVNNFFPPEFGFILSRNLNGTFGCEYHRGEDGEILAYDSWSFFKLKRIWKNLETSGICDEWMQFAIFISLRSIHTSDPYGWHAIFVGEMRKLYDQAIWDLRGMVWEVEAYQKNLGEFKPQFILLHDLARHISHSKEILDVALETLDSIIYSCSIFDEDHPTPAARIEWHSKDIQRQFYFAGKSLRSTKLRCISLSERLQNEINLAFNIVSQRDNEISLQMAQHSLTDNTMMKTVAIVSMIYLPGTFVSGLFGMNFFDFDRESIGVSHDIWIYWLVTVSLTLATIFVWLLWLNSESIRRLFIKLKSSRGY
ncbi:Magnesium transport protein CorA [Penicillium digitatum]|uniref:Magnesium transport protein CorA n=1 Tax=Penicillium digitatum TaxID=36651 RepID=A0A7T7BMN0_PENDI|nr:Magnesium transport protein CorA [Penicillium digitatum]